MAIPTVNSVGAVVSAVAGITVDPGASHSADDIDIVLLECDSADSPGLSTANGFARLTALDQTVTGTQMSVWWRRWNGSDGSPVFGDAGNHQIARMISISGCITTADPWELALTGITDAVADTSVSIIGGTTLGDDRLILAMVCQDLPDINTTTEFGSWANGDLSDVTERIDNSTNVGNGGAIGMASGGKATLGLFGATTATAVTSAVRVCGMLALRPPGLALSGTLFTKAPTFFAGSVSTTYTVTGSLFAKAPTFSVGTITLQGIVFYRWSKKVDGTELGIKIDTVLSKLVSFGGGNHGSASVTVKITLEPLEGAETTAELTILAEATDFYVLSVSRDAISGGGDRWEVPVVSLSAELF